VCVCANVTTGNVENRNTDCDYSSAYVSLYTDSNIVGHGMTFTIGRGNDIVSFAFVSTVKVMESVILLSV
jgi:hypothetical protein